MRQRFEERIRSGTKLKKERKKIYHDTPHEDKVSKLISDTVSLHDAPCQDAEW